MTKESKCVECAKTGSIHVSIVLGGKLTTESYCRAHAEQCGIFHSMGYDLLGLGNIEQEVAVQLELNVLRCESCGCSQHDFEKSGRLGCPQCYLTFGTLLNPLLNKMHAGSSHLGKIPEKAIASGIIANATTRPARISLEGETILSFANKLFNFKTTLLPSCLIR